MATNKLRTVRVLGTDWKYRVDHDEIRLYKPGEKQILQRIKRNIDEPVMPAMMEAYIKQLMGLSNDGFNGNSRIEF